MKKIMIPAIITIMMIGLSGGAVMGKEMTTATFNDWTIELPDGWSGDDAMGLYWQGEIEQFRGRPDTSIHMGGIPVMTDIAFEDRVKQHINSEFTDKTDVTVEGIKGFTCIWENQGKKHYGMFLEEDVGGTMRVIHFFDCRAPVDSFDGLKDAFVKAVGTAGKK